jgi:hypothetical protein
MADPIWQFEHSVECAVSAAFAWEYWSNIENWNDPPAEFHLDGPFEVGSRLATKFPGQEPWYSIIREVIPNRAATLEMQLAGALLFFNVKFEPVTDDRCKIEQRYTLEGPNAATFVEQMTPFEVNAPAGLQKLAATIERAAEQAARKK